MDWSINKETAAILCAAHKWLPVESVWEELVIAVNTPLSHITSRSSSLYLITSPIQDDWTLKISATPYEVLSLFDP